MYLIKQSPVVQLALHYQVKKPERKLFLQSEAHKSTPHYLFPRMKSHRDLTALKFKLPHFWQAI